VPWAVEWRVIRIQTHGRRMLARREVDTKRVISRASHRTGVLRAGLADRPSRALHQAHLVLKSNDSYFAAMRRALRHSTATRIQAVARGMAVRREIAVIRNYRTLRGNFFAVRACVAIQTIW
jgi:hypothetical protein